MTRPMIWWYSCAVNPIIARFPRRALPAVLSVAVLAGCNGTGGTGGSSTAATAAAAPSTTAAAPTATPTPTPRPTGAADPALAPFYGQQLAWAACPDDPATADTDESAVQCATLKVPLDYTRPADRSVDVAVARIPAGKPDQRVGSLLVNPGGPGGSGVGMVKRGPEGYRGPLHDRFDIVGFDPRGVGGTLPVNCLDDRARDAWLATDEPGPDHGKVLADACQAKYGALLPHLGTRDTVRDMDVLRGVLGDGKLSYLGLSYGTYIGSVYAEEFPDRAGRLVLDGAADRSVDLVRMNLTQYAGFERSLRLFAEDCAKQKECPLGKDPAAAPGKLADFLDGLKEKPLTAAGGRRLTASLAWTGLVSLLYSADEKAYTNTRNILGWAMVRGKGDHLLAAADRYNGRDEKGGYGSSADAYTVIHCADGAQAYTAAQVEGLVAEMAAQAPLISRHSPLQAVFDPDCRTWPFRSAEVPHRISAATVATPIVVVGSTGDPATPYAWSEQLAAGLGKAVLLTREGEGHVGYWRSSCVRTAVDGYLVDGTVPAAGTKCASD